MGREVRMVPKDWEHPVGVDGEYIPLFDSGYNEALAEWELGKKMWEKGLFRMWDKAEFKEITDDMRGTSYEQWGGNRPSKDDYMPEWPDAERTHYQMYETCSEGTPISPPMETPEALARWLAANGASALGFMTATYNEWLSMIQRGSAPSMVISNGQIKSGVEDAHEHGGNN